MFIRIMSALVFAPVIIFFLIIKGDYLYLFTGIISLVGLYEYYKAIKIVGIKTIDIIGYVFTVLYYILLYLYPDSISNGLGWITALMIILTFTYEIFTRKSGVNGVTHTIFGFLYVSYLLSHIIYIYGLQSGAILIWLPVITAWFTDTFAYFVGITIGKHRLSPTISPKKSIEGALGGIVGSCFLTYLFGVYVSRYENSIGIINFIVIGLICGIVSQIGDLAASYIKRYAGVKDFGNIIPGHGGILDRFDSILFTAPVVYYYFMIIQNI